MMAHSARQLIDSLNSRQSSKKTLGQHFLHDERILDFIIEIASPLNESHVLEIGPGPGTLSDRLLEHSASVTAIEIDEGACEHLAQLLPNLELISGDCLRIEWPEEIDTIVANIPYQISSPLIEKITTIPSIKRVIIMVQEEFAQRLCVETPADRGSLGMTVMLDWQTKMHTKVAPHCFIPQPQVHSRVVELTRIVPPQRANLCRMMIHQSFAQRRKKIRNTLRSPPKGIQNLENWGHAEWKQRISSLNHSLFEKRPEDLDFQDWLELATSLESA